jgi:hypothetical protein
MDDRHLQLQKEREKRLTDIVGLNNIISGLDLRMDEEEKKTPKNEKTIRTLQIAKKKQIVKLKKLLKEERKSWEK